ncbi:Protein Dr1 [Echinococcus granulosus]|uniref:Protein Dr1 n=1 Tax=Echinococcus granulosus TaxID=6210 RepID=W6U843_ECHGR|nr:Protein Dr1 [Echinococcus granulosus]EUB57330.1 Protein Dr1 [Echinococcus granulosus]
MVIGIEDDFTFKEDEEVAIPRASLNKYIKDILPDARLAIETRELLLSCCHKFIHQLSTEANAACARAKKKTINPEHILSGLDSMGLSSYVADVRAANEGAKVELKDRRMLSASHRFKKHDSAELQRLMEEQERIFELARAGMLEEQQQVNESDLVKAAASTMAALGGGNTAATDTSSKGNTSSSAAATSSVDNKPSTSIPASALLLGGLTGVDEEDNYD